MGLLSEKEVFKFFISLSKSSILYSWSSFTLSSNKVSLLLKSSIDFRSSVIFSREAIRFMVLSGGFLVANISYKFYKSSLEVS